MPWFENAFNRLEEQGYEIGRVARTGSGGRFQAVTRGGEVLATGKENIQQLASGDGGGGGGDGGLKGFGLLIAAGVVAYAALAEVL